MNVSSSLSSTKLKPLVNYRWFLIAALVPLLLAGLFALGVQLLGLTRYDATYFGAAYTEKYNSPGTVARALEQALQSDDQALLAELQGLRQPVEFETSPHMIFVMLWERQERYTSYLYFDMRTFERHTHYVERVKGRWVVSPPDLHYYFHSGEWLKVFMPLAITWWLIEAVVLLGTWIYRASARTRAQIFDR